MAPRGFKCSGSSSTGLPCLRVCIPPRALGNLAPRSDGIPLRRPPPLTSLHPPNRTPAACGFRFSFSSCPRGLLSLALFDSALHRQGRLLWPLLTSARPSRRVAVALGPFGRDGQISGNKVHLFPPAGRGFTTLLRSGLGLCLVLQTCPQVGLRIRFLFVSSGFRVRLPSAASSRMQPCLSLSDSS